MAKEKRMRVSFLGTNGWYATKDGNTPCTVIDAPQAYIVLDAGDGIQHLDGIVRGSKPVHLYLSHFHLDHTAGLHIMPKFDFRGGMEIFGQKGARKILSTLVNRPFTAGFSELKTKVRVHELAPGSHRVKGAGGSYRVTCAPLVHADPCFGYRFEFGAGEGKKTIAYCTDTGPCGNYLKLARGADLLISECTMLPSYKVDKFWPHLSPVIAARLAKEAGCRKLALTHFGANFYTGMKARDMAQEVARKTFANTIAAKDGMTIRI